MEEVYIITRDISIGDIDENYSPDIVAVCKTDDAVKRYIQKCIDEIKEEYHQFCKKRSDRKIIEREGDKYLGKEDKRYSVKVTYSRSMSTVWIEYIYAGKVAEWRGGYSFHIRPMKLEE